MLERVFHVELRVQVSNDRVEDVLKRFVGFFISCIESNWVLLIMDATLDAQLNFAAKMGSPLFHFGPDFLGQMLFKQRMAVFVEDGVVHERNLLRVGTVN